MAKLIDITGKALSGEWGTDDETGGGIPVLRTTNFTNEGVVNYNLYNYSSNFPYFTGFPACSLVK